MPDLDVILTRLREAAADDFIHQKAYIPLADAESAVREARDATVQEIVELLRDEAVKHRRKPGETWNGTSAFDAVRLAADLVARRFPNRGTHE